MLKEIIEKFKALKISENRAAEDDYYEVVFCNGDSCEFDKVLVSVFGNAAKPKGTRPKREDLKLTEEFGGIRDNQVLFAKKADGRTIVALLWPWQDNAHTTLKIAVVK